MADIKQLEVGETTYDIKDNVSRTSIGDVSNLDSTLGTNLVIAANALKQAITNATDTIPDQTDVDSWIASYLTEHPVSGGTVSSEDIATAVSAYLTENPVSGISEETAKQTFVPFTSAASLEYWQNLYGTRETSNAFKAYAYGVAYNADDTYTEMPVPTHINNNTVVHGMVQVVADEGSRWQYDNGNGGHLMELWSKDLANRLTFMYQGDDIMDDGMPVYAIQSWKVADNSHGWMRLASDNFTDTQCPSGFGGIMLSDAFAKSGVALYQLPQAEPEFIKCAKAATGEKVKDGVMFLGLDGIPRIMLNGVWHKFDLTEEGDTCTFTLDTGKLSTLVTTCSALSSDDYTVGSFTAMSTALTNAQNVIAQNPDKQNAYGNAYRLLKAAYNSLIYSGLPATAIFYASQVYSTIITKDITFTDKKYLVAGTCYVKIDNVATLKYFAIGCTSQVLKRMAGTNDKTLFFSEKEEDTSVMPVAYLWDADTSEWVQDTTNLLNFAAISGGYYSSVIEYDRTLTNHDIYYKPDTTSIALETNYNQRSYE